MNKRREAALLLLIVTVAAVLRFTALDWDEYNHYHPDERYIAWVATSVEWPDDLGSAFNPHDSTFNPYYWPKQARTDGIVLEQDSPRRFAYGHVPLYLGVLGTRFLEVIGPTLSQFLPDDWLLTRDILDASHLNEFQHIAAVGRLLAGLSDVASVAVVYVLGKRLFTATVGFLAASFLALSVTHIQLAHFFASDPFLTFFVLSSVTLMVLSLDDPLNHRRRNSALLLASLLAGLAIGSKFSAILILLPLALTVLFSERRSTGRRLVVLLLAFVIVFITFAASNPFALIDWTCDISTAKASFGPLEVSLPEVSSCLLENLVLQGTMVRGTRDVPFVRQYDGTTPFLYFMEMQLRWGMGYLLGLAAFLGFLWAIWRVGRVLVDYWISSGKTLTRARYQEVLERSDQLPIGKFRATSGELVLLAWTLPFFITTGALAVKFTRYIEPLTPFLFVYAALLLLSLPWSKVRWILATIVLIAAGIRAVSFVNMYSQTHPWIAASTWIFENVEQGATILNEAWDDPLPDSVEIDGQLRLRSEFVDSTVNWLSGVDQFDDQTKLEENLQLVAGSDYLILSSNRNYGVIPRLEERYPLSSQYYPLLFDGRLGFDIIYVGTRMPNLLGFSLRPDTFSWPGLGENPVVERYFEEKRAWNGGRFDESFTVYDQPLVIIFKNNGNLSMEEMVSLFRLSERYQ